MALLSGTTWNATGEKMGTQTWKFNTDGTVTTTYPNSQVSTGYFAELPDGAFVIQYPKSSTNPNINNVFTGTHKAGAGVGDWLHYEGNGNQSVLLPFSMVKA